MRSSYSLIESAKPVSFFDFNLIFNYNPLYQYVPGYPLALIFSSLFISSSVRVLLLISMILSSFRSFIIRITLSVDKFVRSLKSLFDNGSLKISEKNIFRARYSMISASLPCICFWVRLKKRPYNCALLSFNMLNTQYAKEGFCLRSF